MFETRLHFIQQNDAINKRKLWEGWLQWANRLSSLDSDNIGRNQFGRNDFRIDTFLEMFHSGADFSDSGGLVSNESGTYVATSQKIASLEIAGEYWVNWSLALKCSDGDSRFVGGVPFIGNTFIGSADDFKSVMGWYQNSDISEAITRTKEWMGGDGEITEFIIDNWDSHGMAGIQRDTKTNQPANQDKWKVYSPSHGNIRITNNRPYVHLSGSGSAVLGRMTGNAGVLLFCNPESQYKILASRLTLHKRNR